MTLLRKSKIKYNWPYFISFPTRNVAWQKAGATGTSLYLSHVCHIQILWNLGKNPFSYLVINPCFITPCFINPCFITPCFINPCFITPCFIKPCFIPPCFIKPCFINPVHVLPIQSSPCCITCQKNVMSFRTSSHLGPLLFREAFIR